jgi:CRP-like cAMP-binding protein
MNPACIRTVLNSIEKLPESECEYFELLAEARYFQRGEHIFQEGKVCQELFFILKGGVRLYYVDSKGKENTYDFSFENSFITAFPSFLDRVCSHENIIALQNTQLLALSYRNYKRLYERNEVWKAVFNAIIARHFLQRKEKELFLLEDDYVARYKKFISLDPSLFLRVEQKHIASYLRMSPETLSRIKRRVYVFR